MQNITSNKIIVGIIISVLSIAALWGVWKMLGTNSPTSTEPIEFKITASDWQKGSSSASATIVEYSDFQCPACKLYAPLAEEVVKKNPNTVRLIYRHYPLTQHKHATLAAYYAEAAGMQGKFFEMHDKLFAGQDDWSASEKPEEIFTTYAKELKLDLDQMKKDIASDKVKNKVQADMNSGNQARIDATPTFFINGVKINPPQSYEEFDTLIKSFITPK